MLKERFSKRSQKQNTIHRKKRLVTFHPQPRMSLTKLSLGGNVANLFLQCTYLFIQHIVVLPATFSCGKTAASRRRPVQRGILHLLPNITSVQLHRRRRFSRQRHPHNLHRVRRQRAGQRLLKVVLNHMNTTIEIALGFHITGSSWSNSSCSSLGATAAARMGVQVQNGLLQGGVR